MVKKNFTRKDLSNKIYQELGFSKSYSSIVIDVFFETMIQELLRSNKIKVSSFGTFKVIYKKKELAEIQKQKKRQLFYQEKLLSLFPLY